MAFELSLGAAGAAVAWGLNLPLVAAIWPVPALSVAVVWGVSATLPMIPVLVGMLFCQWRPIAWLRRLVTRFVRQGFGRASLWQLALVSVAAGLGEEILFRGALQPIAVAATSPVVGVVIVSLLFGLVHAASWSYFWLASLVGAYFGVLAYWRGEILSAAIAHALYDFIALTCIAKGYGVRHRPLFTIRSRSSAER